MREADRLIIDYFNGELCASDFAALDRWITQDPANAERFVRIVADDRSISMLLRKSDSQSLLSGLDAGPGDSTGMMLSDLLAMEERIGDVPPVTLTEPMAINTQRRAAASGDSSKHVGLKRVVVIPYPVFWSAIAAIVMLGLYLFWPTHNGSSSDPAEPVIAEQPAPLVPRTPSNPLDEDAAPVQPNPEHSDAGQPTPPAAPVVATLLGVSDAVWQGDDKPALGRSMTAGQYTLTKGMVRIQFDSETVALIEAPAIFSLDTQSRMSLERGKIVAVCETNKSKGFQVLTPNALVIDLGTVFAVEHVDAKTHMQVIQGQVAVRPSESSQETHATVFGTGQAAVIDGPEQAVRLVAYSESRYMVDWDQAVRLPKLMGDLRYVSRAPQSVVLGEFESSETAQFFVERYGVDLKDGLAVSFTRPGRYDTETSGVSLSTDQPADSYLLHADPQGESVAPLKYSGSVTFDRPILGVIVHGNLITASDEVLGHDGVGYAGDVRRLGSSTIRDTRGLDGGDDYVVLSDDRRTLHFEFIVGKGMDQIRLLVQSPPTEMENSQ